MRGNNNLKKNSNLDHPYYP